MPLQPRIKCHQIQRSFPLKKETLEHQRMRKMSPLNDNPRYIKSLDCSLTTEYNQWYLSEKTLIKNKVTSLTITLPIDPLPVISDSSLAPTMNLWRLRSQKTNQRTYEFAPRFARLQRIQVLFSKLTALPKSGPKTVEIISTTDLVVEQSTIWKQLWESKNALADLQSQLSAIQISAQTHDEDKEAQRRKLLFLTQTLKFRDQQQKSLIMKAKLLIDANRK